MRIAFAGTPPFAACALQALIDSGHEVALVLTQPDRPSGRGMQLKPSAVKEVALRHGLTVITPETLSVKRAPETAQAALATLEAADVDVLIVAAYGLILPERALHAAHGIGRDKTIRSMNIHASLLPRWRGAAPIQRAIEAGDAETGVTLMKMEAGLDTGPMILKTTLALTDTDTADVVTERLAIMGAELTVKALAQADDLTYTVQPEEGVTYAAKILKNESRVDWTLNAQAVARRLRAFTPFPYLSASHAGEVFKIRAARPVEGKGTPGEVLDTRDGLVVACGEGALCCTRLQKAGKGEMPAKSFLQSLPIAVGEVLQ
ncbi:MAG: methionyl-tRNA formyltransferase [Duodenibacillus sp.]